MRPPSRRAVLMGLAGSCVWLPAFTRRGSGAAEGALVRRMVLLHGGFSLGQEEGVVGGRQHAWTDAAPGAWQTLPFGAASLAPVSDAVMLVRGCGIPGPDPLGGIKPGGVFASTEAFHNHQSPLLTGHRMTGTARASQMAAPSADQVLADHLAGLTPLRSLELASERDSVRADFHTHQRAMSYRRVGDAIAPQMPTTDPLAAYLALTSRLDSPDPAVRSARLDAIRRGRSVLDLVARRVSQLREAYSAEALVAIEQHFDGLRDLEVALSAGLVAAGPTCREAPPEDVEPTDLTAVARAHQRVIALALACDLTLVATLLLTDFQSEVSLRSLGADTDAPMHHTVHDGPLPLFSYVVEWHVARFADLVALLRDTPTETGTLLDDTAVLLCAEGGHGVGHHVADGVTPVHTPLETSHCSGRSDLDVAQARRSGGGRAENSDGRGQGQGVGRRCACAPGGAARPQQTPAAEIRALVSSWRRARVALGCGGWSVGITCAPTGGGEEAGAHHGSSDGSPAADTRC